MPIIIEDGTGMADSEAYCTVAFADNYLSGRGITIWLPLLLAEKEAALRRAADYLQQRYRLNWAGYRVKDTQAMDWPRYDVPRIDTAGSYGSFRGTYSSNIVPIEIQRANAEMALRAAAGELTSDVEPQVASEKVDSIEVSYFQGATQIKHYPVIDRLLAPFLQGRGGIRVVKG